MHMTYRSDFFSSLEAVTEDHFVKVADDKILAVTGKGTIIIQEEIRGSLQERELKNVLLVPGLKRNLFSIGTVSNKNFSFHAYKEKCEIRDSNGKLSSIGVRYKTLFRMLFKVKIPIECNVADLRINSNSEKLKLWHERMAHVNICAVKNTCKNLELCELKTGSLDFFCEACIMGKQSRKPHTSSNRVSSFGPGEKIHTDVCGPVNIESPRGSRYFILFKDECTNFRKVYFLRRKSESFGKFREYEALVSTQLGKIAHF